MAPSSLKFVIVEKDPFVAMDMQMGLQNAAAGCEVLHLRDIKDCDTLPACADRLVVITKLSIAQIDASELIQIVGQEAAIVVREGVDTINAVVERGWLSLATPFTDDDLGALTENIRQIVDLATTARPGA